MKKDIEIPIAKDVHVAAVLEWDNDFKEKHWTAYLLNNREDAIEMVMVVSKGYQGDTKTSTMRHGMRQVPSKSYAKIELLQEEVLRLTNEFFVTFFAEGKLFEKKFIFPEHSIREADLAPLPVLEEDGILAQ